MRGVVCDEAGCDGGFDAGSLCSQAARRGTARKAIAETRCKGEGDLFVGACEFVVFMVGALFQLRSRLRLELYIRDGDGVVMEVTRVLDGRGWRGREVAATLVLAE